MPEDKASTLPPWQGRKPLPLADGGWQTVSASAIAGTDGSPPPTALTDDEIAGLVDAFAAATRRAHRIGFDAIELHGAHGYLLHQFLSPLSNQREDEYGGSLENRMRFPLAVYDAVRAEWPDHKPLGVRISATDYLHGGWRMEDSVAFGRRLSQRGCDWIDVSSGGIAQGEKIPVGPGIPGALRRADRSPDRAHHHGGGHDHRATPGRGHRFQWSGRYGGAGQGHALRSPLGLARGGRTRRASGLS